jgi:hypothetical protein
MPSTLAKSDIFRPITELTSGGQCFRNRVALRLLGDNRDSMKFKPIRFNENAHDQSLVFKVEIDKEM